MLAQLRRASYARRAIMILVAVAVAAILLYGYDEFMNKRAAFNASYPVHIYTGEHKPDFYCERVSNGTGYNCFTRRVFGEHVADYHMGLMDSYSTADVQ